MSEYTVTEDTGYVTVCLRSNIGNDDPVTIATHTRHITTSGMWVNAYTVQ